MSQCQQIHETIIRDILDLMDNVKDFDEVEWMKKKNNTGSIARRASNLVLVFPVICSSQLSIQTAMVISKAIERKCVSLLQILFSSIQLTDSDNLYEYLKQFHTNLNLSPKITLDDFMDFMDTMVDEGAIEITDADAYEAVKEDMKNINYHLDTDINPYSINDYRVRKNMYGESYIEKELIQEANNPKDPYIKDLYDFIDYASDTANRVIDKIENTEKTAYRTNAYEKTNNDIKDMSDYFKNQLSTGEVDKANELMPTTMMVSFTNADKKIRTTGVIGVKAKLYPVDSMDIISRITTKYASSNGLFNLVRASTREISFFKDLAFAIDKAKLDAVNMAKHSNNARLFKVLERRANKNKFSSLLKKNDASPITSLVLSQEEVEYMKKYNSMDMEKPYVTRNILDKFNLMDIVIADESLEIAKFLFDDGDGAFETLTFDSLEKEAKDSSYKKVVNLMSQVNR